MKSLLVAASLLILTAFGTHAQTAYDVSLTGSYITQGTYPPANEVPRAIVTPVTTTSFLEAFAVERPKDYRLVIIDESTIAIVKKDGTNRTNIGTVSFEALAVDGKKKKASSVLSVNISGGTNMFTGFSGTAAGTAEYNKLTEGGKIVAASYNVIGTMPSWSSPETRPVIRLRFKLKKQVTLATETNATTE